MGDFNQLFIDCKESWIFIKTKQETLKETYHEQGRKRYLVCGQVIVMLVLILFYYC